MFHINYFAPDNIRRNRYLVSQEAKRAAKLAGVGSMLLALLFHCTLELHARGLSYLSSPNTFNTLSTPAIHNNTTAVDISPSLQRNTTPADTPATPNEPEAPMTSLSMAELKAEMESHHWRLTTGSSILHCLSMSYIAYRMPFSLFINLYHTITFPEHALNRWKVMQLDEHGVYTHCDEFGYEENFVPRKD